jgi:hypothetical protein
LLIFPKSYLELVEFTLPTQKKKKKKKKKNQFFPKNFVKKTAQICLKKTSGASHIRKLEKRKQKKKTNKSFESASFVTPTNEWYH